MEQLRADVNELRNSHIKLETTQRLNNEQCLQDRSEIKDAVITITDHVSDMKMHAATMRAIQDTKNKQAVAFNSVIALLIAAAAVIVPILIK